MTKAEIDLRQQAIKGEKLQELSEAFNGYIEKTKEKVVARLSGHLSPDELMECHAMLMALQSIQDRFNNDITTGKLAEKELMLGDV